MGTIKRHLDLSVPLDTSIWFCVNTLFWGTGRTGECTVKNLNAFDPTIHAKRSDLSEVEDCNGLKQTDVFIPRTKCLVHGKHLYFARQNGDADPEQAKQIHFSVNDPPPTAHLFAYRHGNGHQPLTRSIFQDRLKKVFKDAKLSPLLLHGLHIGGTLEYLLRGLPLEVVRVKGRWTSDAFLLYLRKHVQVMAPYMQAHPHLHRDVLRIVMPRV
ncbi:hypothetical protein D9758_013497 [Tetrapyrgos nigripes]|uniref:Tyr recombinase domain-containing protein n=1 Tax=Tetrapyrgos nigripes TaxID=182062 RepID=A0A8H5D2B8_9AGAR|nr:hypothetical protein D9758_013497 [Tetrapyrgos nigripes]